MSALVYNIFLQWKLDFRNKEILMVYYAVPLVFYLVMGSIFSTTDPNSKNTLIQSMTIFSISMGALLGTPNPLVELFSSDIKRTYKISNIPLWTLLLTTYLSALIHLLIVALIIFVTAPLIYDVTRPENIGLYFLSVILFISLSTILGFIIGVNCKKTSNATMAAQAIFLPTVLLSGIMFPTNMLPSILEKVSYILPATHTMKLLTSTYESSNIIALIGIGVIVLFVLFICYRRLVKNS